MRTHFLVATVLVLGSVLLAQTAPPIASGEPQAVPDISPQQQAYEASVAHEMQPSPSWLPGPDFLKNAHAACDGAKAPPAFAECFIDQMSKAGAPPEAVKFTHALYQHNGDVGIVGRTKSFGPFGLAWVVYPLRANDNNGLMFLNTDPNFLDVDDMSRLDKSGLPKELLYVELKKKYPQLDVWPGDRSGGRPQVVFARTYPPEHPGELRFLFSYPLINGCHACARDGYANYWWDFDANGKFLGTKLISVAYAPPPLKRARPPRPQVPGSMPAQPGSPPQTPSTEPPAPAPDTPHPTL